MFAHPFNTERHILSFNLAQTGAKNQTFWQCADVKIVEASTWKPFDTYTCENVTTSTRTRGGGGNSTTSAVPTNSEASSVNTGVLSGSSGLTAVSPRSFVSAALLS
jgi:hypothetical protein